MKQIMLQAGCQPLKTNLAAMNTTDSRSLLSQLLRGCTIINDTSYPVYIDVIDRPDTASSETDSGAVMYIVAVLVFYSAGIIVMIVKYLRRETRELEEERVLEDFFRSMPAYKKEREQHHVTSVAIHAFHALTSFSYDDGDEVVYTSDEEDVRARADTIHETEAEHHSTADSQSLISSDTVCAHSSTHDKFKRQHVVDDNTDESDTSRSLLDENDTRL